jgi:hypothetical protein
MNSWPPPLFPNLGVTFTPFSRSPINDELIDRVDIEQRQSQPGFQRDQDAQAKL